MIKKVCDYCHCLSENKVAIILEKLQCNYNNNRNDMYKSINYVDKKYWGNAIVTKL